MKLHCKSAFRCCWNWSLFKLSNYFRESGLSIHVLPLSWNSYLWASSSSVSVKYLLVHVVFSTIPGFAFVVFSMYKVYPCEAQEKPSNSFTEIIFSAMALKVEEGFVFISLMNLHLVLFREVVFMFFITCRSPLTFSGIMCTTEQILLSKKLISCVATVALKCLGLLVSDSLGV